MPTFRLSVPSKVSLVALAKFSLNLSLEVLLWVIFLLKCWVFIFLLQISKQMKEYQSLHLCWTQEHLPSTCLSILIIWNILVVLRTKLMRDTIFFKSEDRLYTLISSLSDGESVLLAFLWTFVYLCFGQRPLFYVLFLEAFRWARSGMWFKDGQMHLKEGPRVSHIFQLNFKYESWQNPPVMLKNERLFIKISVLEIIKKF